MVTKCTRYLDVEKHVFRLVLVHFIAATMVLQMKHCLILLHFTILLFLHLEVRFTICLTTAITGIRTPRFPALLDA